MPVSDASLRRLAHALQITDEQLTRAHATKDQLECHLRSNFRSCLRTEWPIERVLCGGSVIKGTALASKFDVDMRILLQMPVEEYLDEETQGQLKHSLERCLGTLPGLTINQSSRGHSYPSVGCELWGIEFDVLVGVSAAHPARSMNWYNDPGLEQLRGVQEILLWWENGLESALATACRLSGACMESTDMAMRMEKDVVKQAVILMKQWRTHASLPNFKSFVAELLVLTAARRIRMDRQRMDVKGLLRRSLDILDLRWQTAWPPRVLEYSYLKYYEGSEWGEWIAGRTPANFSKRLLIVNPVLPLLDVIHKVQPRELYIWCQAAVVARQKLDDPTSTLETLFGIVPATMGGKRASQMPAKSERGRRLGMRHQRGKEVAGVSSNTLLRVAN